MSKLFKEYREVIELTKKEKVIDFILGSLGTWAIVGVLFLIANRIY